MRIVKQTYHNTMLFTSSTFSFENSLSCVPTLFPTKKVISNFHLFLKFWLYILYATFFHNESHIDLSLSLSVA